MMYVVAYLAAVPCGNKLSGVVIKGIISRSTFGLINVAWGNSWGQ